MKRSEINRYIAEADAFCAANHFLLPPFAHWTPEDWQQRGSEANDIRAARLGWDVTDFCSGHFDSFGLTLFTMRNGTIPGNKVYAEKLMFVRLNQHNPLHYHISKTEDIINRGLGTGRLAVELYNSTPAEPGSNGGLAQTPVTVVCDGVVRQVEAGGTVVLGPGESVTLTPYLYHRFYAIGGHGLIGEVSSVNDDATDNYFYEALPRFPKIEEDEPPLRLLCNEYPGQRE